MARKKRHKRQVKRVTNKQTPDSASADDLIVARKISTINLFIVSLGIFPYMYPLMDFIYGRKKLLEGWDGIILLWICLLVNIGLMIIAVRINAYSKGIFDEYFPAKESAAKYRKLGVWQLTVAMLINVIACIPILYGEGYLTAWANQMPGTDIIGKKISFAVLFLLAAIATGLLGNFVYDILKFFFKKLIGRQDG